MKRFFSSSEKGTILMTSFILVFVLVSFSSALFFPSSIRTNAVQRDLLRLKVLNVAEAGLSHALYKILREKSIIPIGT